MRSFSQITDDNFNTAALVLFGRQYLENKVYGEFCDLLGRTPETVTSISDIPFLPVEVFKSHVVKSGDWQEEEIYTSSTTSGGVPSQHFVHSLAYYKQVYEAGLERVYGSLEEYAVLALLPSYLERTGSSLVAMAEGMIQKSDSAESGFYLHNHEDLFKALERLKQSRTPVMLLGVTFGLLDFAESIAQGKYGSNSFHYNKLRVIETGGMKGKRKELIRPEVHRLLKESFPESPIDSEYGMTELLSQAYLIDSGNFESPPWMRFYTREVSDPLAPPMRNGSRGALNVIDLANSHSCAFLSLSDQGQVFENGTFEVYGRLDRSEIRGCNLMVSL